MFIKKGRVTIYICIIALTLPLVITSINSQKNLEKNNGNSCEFILDSQLLKRPKMGYLYVYDREIVNLGGRITVIIGKITINGETQRDIIFDRVEFWIDRTIMSRDHRPPYEYTYDEETIGWHTLRMIAYLGERTLTDDLRAFIYNTGKRT
jgi:hypothetical protein